MKTLSLKLSLVVLFSLVIFSCSNDDGIYFDESSEVLASDLVYSPIESEILDLVNQHRSQLGLSILKPLNIVSNTADTHTEYMIEVGQISHDNFSERSQNLMNKANAKLVAENVAYGFNSAQGVVKGWLNSEGHKAIIENPKYTHFGISTEACAITGRNYFTQIFINK